MQTKKHRVNLIWPLTVLLMISACDKFNIKIKQASTLQAPAPSDCIGSMLTNSPYAAGLGTQASPFLICTVTQLAQMASDTSHFTSSFKLLADIDMSGVTFDGIGSSLNPFRGQFLGNNKSISNMSILRVAGNQAGFFNQTQNAYVSNVTFINASVSAASSNDVGVVTGRSLQSFYQNVSTISSTVVGLNTTGTFLGYGFESTIIDTSLSGTVDGVNEVGGLGGSLDVCTVLNAVVAVNVDATALGSYVGGVAGVLGSGESYLQNVNYTGTILADYEVGGIIGGNYAFLTLNRSSFNGAIDANNYVGGIMGANYRNSSVSSVSSNFDIDGDYYVGGVIGNHYSDTAYTNILATGSIASKTAGSFSFGGFFGQMDDWGSVEDSLVVLTTTGLARQVGGFVGRRFSGADPFTVNDVAVVGNITGSAAVNSVSLFTGSTFQWAFTGTSYYWTGGFCDNIGAGICNTPVETPIVALGDFYVNTGLPFSNWDFTNVWMSNSGAYPTLRQSQSHAPSYNHTCPLHALVGLNYSCAMNVTDLDVHEFQMISFTEANACRWAYSNGHKLKGIADALDIGSCSASFSVSDGEFSTSVESLTINVHDEISIAPLYDPGTSEIDYGTQDINDVFGNPLQIITITNNKSFPLNGFTRSGLVEGSFVISGGTCGATLAAGSSCNVIVTFDPVTVGDHHDTIIFTYDAGAGPIDIAYGLKGMGY